MAYYDKPPYCDKINVNSVLEIMAGQWTLSDKNCWLSRHFCLTNCPNENYDFTTTTIP